MSQPASEIGVEFGFAWDSYEYRGVLVLRDQGKNMMVEIKCNKTMRPLEVEKALYQIAHIIAEKTQTASQLRQEKLDVWT